MVFLLVQRLRRLHPDLRITLVLPPGGVYVKRFRSLDVPTIEFPLNRISPLHVPRFVSLVLSMRPDVLHSHGKGAGLYARMVPRILCRARRVHSYHGFHPPYHPIASSIYHRLESTLLNCVDAVAAISIGEAEEVRTRFPRFKGRITALPNVVDCNDLDNRSRTKVGDEIESFLAANRDRVIVSMVARKDPVKNYPLALSACRLVMEQIQNVAFVFVGIEQHDPGLAAVVKSYPSRVLGVSGEVDAVPIVNRSDIVLLTSRKEGSPLVVLEAFCLGKPVIGTDVEGIRELVRDGENGFLCGESDEEVAAAIQKLSTDKALLQRLGEHALAASKGMDVSAWAEKYYDMYCLQ